MSTHIVTLTYRTGSTTRHEIANGEAGLRALAGAARRVTGGHAVILDRAAAALETLLELGWTSSWPAPAHCPHYTIIAGGDPGCMLYTASCPTCGGHWTFEDIDLPEAVEQRAMSAWEELGL
jgi:hypothetical protein